MTLHKERRIGRLSVLLLLNEAEESTQVEELERDGWKVCLGKVGSMDAHKVVAAVILLTMRGKMPKRGEVAGEKSTTLQDRTKRSLRTQMKKQK